MKIIDNRKNTEYCFGDLIGGSVFEWEGDFYLKTIGEDMVRLDDGQPDGLDRNTLVRPVNATLTIS